MPSARRSNKPGHVTKGDVLDDLGLTPEEALEEKVKADLWRDLIAHIERRGLDATALAHVLKIYQPDVSNLLRGKLSKFSTAKLIKFAVRLDLEVQVKLTEPKRHKGAATRIFSTKTGIKNRELVGA